MSVEKDAYAKEIVLNIITAAKKKRQSSLDSPDLSERNDGSPQGTPTPKAGAVGGSVHSLVELGSTGCQPALPVDEACEYRAEIAPVAPERKRSASLGGETVLPPPPSLTGSHDLAGISELDAAAGPVSSDLRPRTSSGSFVVIKVPPIDAAGIRSYSGLSAVTQERIRLFEQVRNLEKKNIFLDNLNCVKFTRRRRRCCSAIWPVRGATAKRALPLDGWTKRTAKPRPGCAPNSRWRRTITSTRWPTILPVRARRL